MKKAQSTTNIIRAVFVFILLIFIFNKNEQLGLRIMIISFLLLTVCYIAESLCKLINKPIGAKIFHKLFVIIFLLFGFGFLIVWSYAWIKEKQYLPLLFTIPFWIFEIYIVRKSLLSIKRAPKQTEKKCKFDFRIAVSCFLVFCILFSGIICLVIGIRDTYNTSLVGTNRNSALIYFGAFFILGGMVFVSTFLYAIGVFDKVKIDILGIYVGIVFFIVGIGIIAFQMEETSSLSETVERMGFWILIPIMFIIIGGFQTIKCLLKKDKKKEMD